MPTLHAFFVAINEYPNPADKLYGCIPDMMELKSYLDKHCQLLKYEFKSHALVNGKATRAAVIAGFDHFDQAVAGDTCLFGFFGHGARIQALEEFRHLETDGKSESIVCWDSRQPGGSDLMDKELSYLIWKATKDKNIHFLTIMDCCHSGVMRTHKNEQKKERVRGISGLRKKPQQEYLGFVHYENLGDGRFNPPRGRYVHLAAALDRQTAKEVFVQEASRGVFTYSLIEALEEAKGFITYSELVDRCNRRTRLIVKDQSPQLVTTHAEDQSRLFLTNEEWEGPIPYLVSYDKNLGWNVNAGMIHGLTTGDGEDTTTLKLKAPERIIQIVGLQTDRAIVSGMDSLDQRRSYQATLHYLAEKNLNIGFHPSAESAGKSIIQTQYAENPSHFFQLSDHSTADFQIHAHGNQFWLSRKEEKEPLFGEVHGWSPQAAAAFLSNLETVARWWLLLQRANPNSSLGDRDVEVSLFRVTDLRREDSFAPTERLSWKSHPLFTYQEIDGEWYEPSFQLKLKNTSSRSLWLSVVFLGVEFGITNQLLPKQLLEPGQEIWATFKEDDFDSRTIPLLLQEAYLKRNISRVHDYIKIFVSTHEFSTDGLNQEGLSMEAQSEPTRSIGRPRRRKRHLEVPDWTCFDIALEVAYQE